jgi:putative ABC transport system permease protein
VASVAERISTEFTEYGAAGRRYDTVGLQVDGTREIRPMLLALFGGVAILLAIACVNVAGLLIARAAARQKEITLRAALGASRARLLRQCLVEGLVLAGLGGVAGVVVGHAVLAGLLGARPPGLERMALARIDTAVLGFTALVTLGWGLILSIAPLAEVHRTDLARALQRDGWQTGGAVRRRARTALVVVQIALGTVLLVSAGLVARTFLELRRVDPGFRSDGVMTFRLALPRSRYATPPAANDATRRLQEALAALPGARGAGAISHLPFDHLPNWGGPYLTEAGGDPTVAPMADYRSVTPGLFGTLGARIVDGRDFDAHDGPGAPAVVIVDETLARRTWPGATAVGQRLAVDPRSTGDLSTWATVVGVVRHVRHRSLALEVREQVYFPQAQVLRNPLAWVVRADGDADRLAPAARGAVAALDPRLPTYDVRPLAEYVSAARAAQRFTTLLAVAFASVALGLAVLGLYGVIAYSVARRRQEFGVRMAIGARASQVQAMVVGEGMGVVVRGLALGVPAAAAGAWLLRDQLFAVAPGDPATWATALGVLAAAALAASWRAARRATAASPMDVLRAG